MIVSTLSNSVSHAETREEGLAKRPLLWLNVLCLDAPAVAIAWQWFFARAFGVELNPAEAAALFLTAWGIYLFDRVIDSLRLGDGIEQKLRERFCRRHRVGAMILLLLVGLTDVVIVLRFIERMLLIPGAVVALLVILYLGVNHIWCRVWRGLPIKELTTGFVFAAGTTFVPLARSSNSPGALLAVFLFAVVCSINCLSIAVWEREWDEQRGTCSFAVFLSNAAEHVRALSVVSLILCAIYALGEARYVSLGLSLALSALFLLLLQIGGSIRHDERTALADLVLLTPVLFLVFRTIT